MPRGRSNRGYRYGRWHGGPDPLAPPYDVAAAVDELGDSVLGGSGVREALRDLLRRGADGRPGLDQLRRSVRDRLRQARQAGRMDGTLEQVRELLDRAVAAGDALLSPGVTRRLISEFADRSRGTASPRVLEPLTDREREVVALVGEGLNNDEIGGRLFMSPATAKTHVSRAMIKLQARDRAQLVVIAYQSGLVR